MSKPRRKLPVLFEQAVGSIQAEATDKGFAFERLIRKDRPPTCSKGCDHCCYYPIEISVFEAIPIYRHLVQQGRWTPSFIKTVREHAKTTSLLASSVWLLTKVPCPLLVDRKCSAHGVRPFHCRTFFSFGDPYYCDGLNFGSDTGLVSKEEVMRNFRSYEKLLSEQAGLSYIIMPVSRALLIAEELVQGVISPNDVTRKAMLDVLAGNK